MKFRTMMYGIFIFFVALGFLGTSIAVPTPKVATSKLSINKSASALIDSLQGKYTHRFENGLIDGTEYQSEDVLEIVKVKDEVFYFKLFLNFYNGHSCSVVGTAKYQPSGKFIFKDPDKETKCQLSIVPKSGGILLLDQKDYCRYYCGARGGMDGYVFDKQSKRPIRSINAIKNREDYKEAVSHLPQ